jgi:TonB family protein
VEYGIHLAQTKSVSIRSATFSIALHACLFFFLVSKNSFFPETKPLVIQPTLRVDLVGLPDQLKNELPTALPNRPEQVEPEATKRDVPAPPPVAEKNDLVIPTKEKVKPLLQKEIDRKTQISQALKRIKSIERLKDLEEKSEREKSDAASATLIKGNKVSPGNSLSGEAKEALEVSYYEKVKDALTENWSLPPWLAKQDLAAQVMIQIDESGQLKNLRFLKSSGNSQFDGIVKETIQSSLPLPKPPKNLINQISEKGIVLGFPL